MSLGDFALGTTIYKSFTTVTTTGAPTQLAGTPVLSVYENGGTTEITAGVSLTVDLDTRTGLNLATVVATSGNGFEAGKFYDIVITTGTVGGTSVVGYVVASFSIEAGSALRPTTAGRTLDVTATGAAGVDWGNVENVSTANNLSGTSVGTAAAVTAIDTGGIVAASFAAGAINAAAIAADAIGASELAADAVAEIADAVWDEARSGHTTDGSFGQVNQAVRSATAQGGGTNTITLDASASATDDLYNGCLAWIVGGTGAGQAGVITDYVGSTKVATVDNNWRTNPDATSVFVLLPGSLGLTSATLAGAVWDAATTSYATAGTFGKAVADVLDDTGTSGVASVTGAVGSVTGNVGGNVVGSVASVTGAVGSVTGNVGGNVVGSVASVTGAVGSVTAGVTLAASAVQAIWDAATSALTTVGSIGKRLVDYLTGDIYARLGAPAGASTAADIAAIKAETASILTDTAEIGAAGAGLTAIASAANLATLTAYVDTEVAAIKAKTDLLPASPAATGDAMTLTSGERAAIAAALLDLADGIETGMTPRQTLRLLAAGIGGKLSGGGTATEVFRNAVADAKARITATVDASGNRTAITYDLT